MIYETRIKPENEANVDDKEKLLKAKKAVDKIMDILKSLDDTQEFISISSYIASKAIDTLTILNNHAFEKNAQAFIKTVIMAKKECEKQESNNHYH